MCVVGRRRCFCWIPRAQNPEEPSIRRKQVILSHPHSYSASGLGVPSTHKQCRVVHWSPRTFSVVLSDLLRASRLILQSDFEVILVQPPKGHVKEPSQGHYEETGDLVSPPSRGDGDAPQFWGDDNRVAEVAVCGRSLRSSGPVR